MLEKNGADTDVGAQGMPAEGITGEQDEQVVSVVKTTRQTDRKDAAQPIRPRLPCALAR